MPASPHHPDNVIVKFTNQKEIVILLKAKQLKRYKHLSEQAPN